MKMDGGRKGLRKADTTFLRSREKAGTWILLLENQPS
jgi:hypothetical protein